MHRLLLIGGIALFALAQQSSSALRRGEVSLFAEHQQRAGSKVHLSGNVKVETDSLVVRADSADYDNESREIRAQGNVVVKLK